MSLDWIRPLAATAEPPQASVTSTPASAATAPAAHAPTVTPGEDLRLLHPLLNQQSLDRGILAVDEWRITGARKDGTATASTDLVNVTAHGFAAGDKVTFVALTGGAGLTKGQAYYVMSWGLAANAFKVSATSGGSAVDIGTDYSALTVVDVMQLGRVVAGNVERDPLSAAEKATLSLSVAYANEPLRQLAVMIDDVPNKLLESIERFGDYLDAEARYVLLRAADTHTIARILAANPLVGSGGTRRSRSCDTAWRS
jgi:hypothetical protein